MAEVKSSGPHTPPGARAPRGARRPGGRPRRGAVGARFALYLAACWALVATAAWGAFPGAPWVVLGWALYTAVPLLVFLARLGWSFYPGAAFRLLVFGETNVLFTPMGMPSLWEMLVFLGILMLGWAYAYRKGALEWV